MQWDWGNKSPLSTINTQFEFERKLQLLNDIFEFLRAKTIGPPGLKECIVICPGGIEVLP